MLKISAIRETRGWSRAELARRANLNATTVGLIEAGRLRPYPGQLAKLAIALGVGESEAPSLVEPVGSSPSAPRDAGLRGGTGWTR